VINYGTKVEQDNCLGCGVCVVACPVNVSISPEVAGGHGSKTEEVHHDGRKRSNQTLQPRKMHKMWNMSNVLPYRCYMLE
jgi:Fe-S-cluster-containing dehydrogenase component